jgi:hypothetical protein
MSEEEQKGVHHLAAEDLTTGSPELGNPKVTSYKPTWWQRQSKRNRLLLKIFIGWAFVLFAAHTKLFYWLEIPGLDDKFAESFWPNFIADFGVGILLAWFLGDVLDRASHYDLRMEITSIRFDPYESTIGFWVVNNGEESFRSNQIKWNIYVERDVNKIDDLKATNPDETEIFPVPYHHYHGVLNEPLFVGERAKLKEVDLIRKGSSTSYVYFFFSTEHGVRPRDVKMRDGQVLPTSLPKLTVSLPDKIEPSR